MLDKEAEDRSDRRWRPVYASVVIFTALVIIALWLFSRAYTF